MNVLVPLPTARAPGAPALCSVQVTLNDVRRMEVVLDEQQLRYAGYTAMLLLAFLTRECRNHIKKIKSAKNVVDTFELPYRSFVEGHEVPNHAKFSAHPVKLAARVGYFCISSQCLDPTGVTSLWLLFG